jgi:hypothetical protein
MIDFQALLAAVASVEAQTWVDFSAWSMLWLSIATFIAFFFMDVSIPMGKFFEGKKENKYWCLWLPPVPFSIAWAFFESPSWIIPCFLWPRVAVNMPVTNHILLVLYMCQVVYLSMIYPFSRVNPRPMPFGVILITWSGELLNSYMNIVTVMVSREYEISWLWDPRFIIGLIIFVVGFYINTDSDRRLTNLRKPGETDFKIPHGGMFEYVSAANYFGDIIKMFGWCVISWSFPSFSILCVFLSTIFPRGLQYHQWYLKKFPDYPKDRKAVIPFIL